MLFVVCYLSYVCCTIFPIETVLCWPIYVRKVFIYMYFLIVYLSLAMLEFLDIDFGDISKSESDRYRNDSRRCGRFCKTRPALGEPPSSGDRAPCPFSTSKLIRDGRKREHKTFIRCVIEFSMSISFSTKQAKNTTEQQYRIEILNSMPYSARRHYWHVQLRDLIDK